MCNIIFASQKIQKNATVLRYIHKTVALFTTQKCIQVNPVFQQEFRLIKIKDFKLR